MTAPTHDCGATAKGEGREKALVPQSKGGQSRFHSAAEVLTNTVIGGAGAWVIVYLCMRLIPDPALAATVSVVSCAIWSLVRGYSLRRWFNRRPA